VILYGKFTGKLTFENFDPAEKIGKDTAVEILKHRLYNNPV